MAKVRGFDDVPAANKDDAKIEDVFELFEPKRDAKDEYVTLRFMPTPILPIKRHWVMIMAGKDGQKRAIPIPVMCVSFDPDNEDTPLEGRECPFCKLPHGKREEGFPASDELRYLCNVIVRDIQESAPKKQPAPTKDEAKSGYKDIKSKTWTPVRVCILPPGATRRLKDLGSRNIPKQNKKKPKGPDGKTAYPVNHAKYGIDVDIRFNPKAAGSEKYSIEPGERCALTSEEKGYLVWNLDDWPELYDTLGRMTTEEAEKKLARMDVIGLNKADDDDDDDDDDSSKSRVLGKKKSDTKSDKKSRKLDDDDDDEEDDDDDSSKSRVLGKKKSDKSKLKSKKSSKDDDKPSKSKLKSKKSSKDDDDDDKPSKSKLKSKKADKSKLGKSKLKSKK